MADFPHIPFDEAVTALRRRGTNLFPSEHWATVWQEQHHAGFTVARSAGFDILKDVHAALMKAMENGTTFADFKRDLIPTLQKKGWWGRTTVIDPETREERTVQLGSVRRLETIFDVNMNVSYAQGRWEQQQKLKGAFPYLRYEGILDSKIRPQHRRWHGIILPVDHPWWKTHYPPNGWKCRCDAVSVSVDDLELYGWRVSETPADEGVVTWINPATGEVMDVPAGIDPGWAYNPGNTDRAAQLARLAMDKLITLPASIGAAAVAELASAFPQVERELGEWINGITARVAAGDFRTTGERRVVGAFGDDVLHFLEAKGISPTTAAVSISDEDLTHTLRTAKVDPLPPSVWKRLPSLFIRPENIYWDKQNPGVVYVLNEREGAGKIIVLVDYATRFQRKQLIINTIRTGKLVKSLEEFDN
ncbi:MAG: phage minor head protein, partial [Bilophila sp.]